MKKNIFILGANSDLAKSLSLGFASDGYDLTLFSRNINSIKAHILKLKNDFNVSVKVHDIDLNNFNLKIENIDLSNLYGIICCAGYLGNQQKASIDQQEVDNIFNSNFIGIIKFIDLFKFELIKKNQGFILGISSIAGSRGRKKNYYYGCAKAGLTNYLSGLRSNLFQNNIDVFTVLPGFIDTKMIKNLRTPSFLTIQPDALSKIIIFSIKKRKYVIYQSLIWRIIDFIIKNMPEFIFKKIKF